MDEKYDCGQLIRFSAVPPATVLEEAELVRQQKQQEKRERARRLWFVIDSQVNTVDVPWASLPQDSDVLTLEFEGHKFEVKEVK